MEHSVEMDFTFSADQSLPRAGLEFLDSCFIMGFTYFPVAVLTSLEEGVISKRSLTAGREAGWVPRERLALGCPCRLLHKQKSVLCKGGVAVW